MKDSIKPKITIRRTNAQLQEDGYTYNESGFTYNEPVAYGGIYEHDIYPIIASARPSVLKASATQIKMSVKAQRTNAQLNDQGYTYNESGFSYNEAIAYGGIYEHDIVPMIAKAKDVKPSIVFGRDFSAVGSVAPTTIYKGYLVGMLGMTYPQDL